jgi:hypothetical protein
MFHEGLVKQMKRRGLNQSMMETPDRTDDFCKDYDEVAATARLPKALTRSGREVERGHADSI